MIRSLLILLCLNGFSLAPVYANQQDDDFEDISQRREIAHPSWFKESFLNLQNDLKDAVSANKKGIAVYFGQEDCAYCQALMSKVLSKPDIKNYFNENFDVIALDIWGNREVTLIDGDVLDEHEYAILEDTNFTPSFLFYDAEGELVFRMRGYNNPYRFRAMLKFIAEGYYKKETFRTYMARAQAEPKFDDDALNSHALFSRFLPIFDRRNHSAQKILAVVFEQANCHACDQLHSEPLNSPKNLELLKAFEVHQLNGLSKTPILTPQGEKKTAQQWADDLNIHYYPSILFFNELGAEIMRIDSVVKLYRMRGVLEYLASEGFKKYPTYLRWRRYHLADQENKRFK